MNILWIQYIWKEVDEMFFTKKKKTTESPSPIDTIVVIGNGFDRWQGLNTSYADFQTYYHEHLDEILKKLHIKKRKYVSPDGTTEEWSDVELIYGDPFEPGELDNEFWNNFENSLADIDAERLNLFFGKERSDLKDMRRSIRNAKRILTEAFCGWIATISITEEDAGYKFGDNCVFINFNYTDTLRKRFGVDEMREFHIHGEATDKKSIVFGHNRHPQEPETLLAQMGGRFGGLHLVDEILYETDKHCQDNILILCMFLAMNGVMCEEIKDIYVLGQSMSPVDIEYFDFLMRCSKVPSLDNAEEESGELEAEDELDELDELNQRMQFIIDEIGYHNTANENAANAMERWQQREQAARNEQYSKEFLKMLGKPAKTELDSVKVAPRTEDAKWHISYFGDTDKEWKEIVMKELGCSNYQLYPSIDECISRWKK